MEKTLSRSAFFDGRDAVTRLAEKSLRAAAEHFRARQVEALRLRIDDEKGPRWNPKRLAGIKTAGGRALANERTMRAWRRGENDMGGEELATLQGWFFDQGDLGFISDTIGRDVEALVEQRAAELALGFFQSTTAALEARARARVAGFTAGHTAGQSTNQQQQQGDRST